MSMSKIALAIPLALGIACSTSGTQSRDGTTGSWQRSSPPAQASSQPADTGGSHEDLAVQPTAGSDSTATTGSSDSGSQGSSGTGAADTGAADSGAADSGSQGAGGQGSGGASETMGTEKEQGGSAQGSPGSSDQAQQGAGNAGDMAVAGKITKISKDEISIQPKGGKAKTLKLSDSTSVVVNGKDAKWSQLKKGQSVRASYENAGGDDTAIRVETGAKRHGRMKHHGTSGGSGMDHGSGMGGSSGSSGGSSSDTGTQH